MYFVIFEAGPFGLSVKGVIQARDKKEAEEKATKRWLWALLKVRRWADVSPKTRLAALRADMASVVGEVCFFRIDDRDLEERLERPFGATQRLAHFGRLLERSSR